MFINNRGNSFGLQGSWNSSSSQGVSFSSFSFSSSVFSSQADITGGNITGNGKLEGTTVKGFDLNLQDRQWETKSVNRRPGHNAPDMGSVSAQVVDKNGKAPAPTPLPSVETSFGAQGASPENDVQQSWQVFQMVEVMRLMQMYGMGQG